MSRFLSSLSAVIIVADAKADFADVLCALKDFDEIVIYDNGRDPRTKEISRGFANVSYHQGPFLGFGESKNYAASLARHDWIFSLDADEIPDATLLASLDAWPAQESDALGEIRRINYFCERAIYTNGWGKDYLLRLYHRKQHAFSSRRVHESIQRKPTSQIKRLHGQIRHKAYDDIKQLLDKAQHYSELYAQSEEAKTYPFPIIVLKTLFAFIRSYFLKGGLFSGWRGFSIAFGEMIGVFFKYAKVYQRRENNKKGNSTCA